MTLCKNCDILICFISCMIVDMKYDHFPSIEAESNSSASMSTDTVAGEAAGATGDEEASAPCVVVYLLEPGAGGERRTACLAMLRAATTLMASLPEHIRANVSVQVLCSLLPTLAHIIMKYTHILSILC